MGAMRWVSRFGMTCLAGLLLAVAQAHAAAPGAAAPAVVPIDSEPRQDLVPHLLHAEDPSGTWWPYDGLGRLRADAAEPDFVPVQGPGAANRLGFSQEVQWFQVRLRHSGTSPLRRWLVVGNPHLDRIDLLIGSQGQLVTHDRGGDQLPFDHRAVPHRQHVFPIDLLPGQSIDLHLRVQSASSLEIPVDVWLPEALIRRDHAIYLLLGLYFGLSVGLMGQTLVMYAAMRDRVYLLYAGLRLTVGLGLLALSGLGAEFMWTEGGHWNRTLQQLGITLAGVLALEFSRRFLGTGERLPQVDRHLLRLRHVWLACFVLTSLWPQHPFVPQLLMLAVATVAALVLLGILALRLGLIGAPQFLAAWTAMLAGALLELVIRVGWWDRPDSVSQPLVIGSTCDMILMAFALGEHIRSERRARQQAQAQQISEAARLHEARRTSAEKSRLLAAVCHDLRQPVYAITLAADSLAQQRDRPVPTVALTQMREAIASADHLLDTLHTMSRLEVGGLRPQITAFSIQPLLERMDVVYGLQARSKGLRWTVTPGIARVLSDPILLERILGNLVANAVRYTQRGGVVVACRPRRDGLLVQVWDTGIGVLPEHADTIFDAYFRGVPETETDSGVGLGLFIVRESAALLGIALGMRSRPGRGSCFWIKIPLALSGQAMRPVPAAPTHR